jgi:transposase-like protein
MRLHVLLSKVDPKAMPVPTKCAYADCTSKQVRLHQPVIKALRDTVHQQVEVHRYRCLKCQRTFRVYPAGVTHAHSSDRVKGLAVMLYLLGLSYGAVSLALESLGVPLSKTWVYEIVQEVATRIPESHAGASLPRGEDGCPGRRPDECQMRGEMAASGSECR